MPPLEEYVEEIKDIWESRWLTTMGPKHDRLEKELADYLKVKETLVFSNGHTALESVIRAFGLKGEIITTPFTFASTTHAIVNCGIRPVFCDVRTDDLTIDTASLEPLITEHTTAILPVHVYGNICDVEGIERLASRYDLKVIYDAAHAFGIERCGKGIASWGDAAVFSFHASKVFHTIEGGAVAYSDRELGEVLKRIRNFGMASENNVTHVGGNGKMNEFEAAMGLCNLRHIDEEIEKRKAADSHYRKRLKELPQIRMNVIPADVRYNYAYFPVMVLRDEPDKGRDAVYDALHSQHFLARKQFYPLTSQFQCYAGQFGNTETKRASYISDHILALPLYAELEEQTIDGICEIIKQVTS